MNILEYYQGGRNIPLEQGNIIGTASDEDTIVVLQKIPPADGIPYSLMAFSDLKTWVNNFIGTITGTQGPKGDQGDQGTPGIQGPSGIQGPMGLSGANGAQGNQGAQGTVGSIGGNGATGATGAAGPQGALGPTGNTGPQGVAGATGATGATGTVPIYGAAGHVATKAWSGNIVLTTTSLATFDISAAGFAEIESIQVSAYHSSGVLLSAAPTTISMTSIAVIALSAGLAYIGGATVYLTVWGK